MAWTCLALLLALSATAHASYNPIPVGGVIVSTVKYIYVLQPSEYGGTNTLDTIFSATGNMSIVNTVFDPDKRNLYVMYVNSASNSTVYISQLTSVEKLSSTVFQLPFMMDVSSINQLTSFSSDILNRRVFLTDRQGRVRAYSMAGLMQTDVVLPASISPPVRSIFYANTLNKLFVINDTKIHSCTNFDSGALQCCPGQANGNQLRAITVDTATSDTPVYVLDERSGVYRAVLSDTGCPTSLNPINTFTNPPNLHFAVDRGLLFVSSGGSTLADSNYLLIANGSQTARSYSVGGAIVALHVSAPSMAVMVESEQTCFHGISYGDYRAAVILAALFGTLMGILLCFNTLFCIDFLMTKRIIRNLKQQIPHNLLEDRWNKLVEEKYAKIALEKQRKKDDPPPKRLSSIAPKSYTPAVGSAVINATTAGPGGKDDAGRTDSLTVPNPIPRLSAYLRRKSESYVSRRRSDDPRASRQQQPTFVQVPEARPRAERVPANIPEIHIGPVPEENEAQRGLRSNLSRQELLHDDDFL